MRVDSRTYQETENWLKVRPIQTSAKQIQIIAGGGRIINVLYSLSEKPASLCSGVVTNA